MHDKVDVLIIGSGASGAAVAWRLAETKMRILCLEQGDWVNGYPSMNPDWETSLRSYFFPNVRKLTFPGQKELPEKVDAQR